MAPEQIDKIKANINWVEFFAACEMSCLDCGENKELIKLTKGICLCPACFEKAKKDFPIHFEEISYPEEIKAKAIERALKKGEN